MQLTLLRSNILKQRDAPCRHLRAPRFLARLGAHRAAIARHRADHRSDERLTRAV